MTKQTAIAQWPLTPAEAEMYMISSDELVEGQAWANSFDGYKTSVHVPLVCRPVWVSDLVEIPENMIIVSLADVAQLVTLGMGAKEADDDSYRAASRLLDRLVAYNKEANRCGS